MDCLRDNLQENPDIWIYKTHGFRWRFSREKPIHWNGQLFFLESATWQSCSYQGLLCFAWCSLWAFGIPGWWAVQSVASPWKVPSPNPPGIVSGFAKGSIKDLHIWKDTQIEGAVLFSHPGQLLATLYSISCKLLTENMQTTSTNCGLKTGWMTFLPDSWVTRSLEIRFGILMISLEWAICFPLLVCIADFCMSLKSRHAGSD